MKRIFLTTNECCPRRLLDMEKLANYFRANGCELVSGPKNADYIIFMSCAFIKRQVDLALKKIWILGKYEGEVIVTGCLPKIHPDSLKNVHKGKIVPVNNMDMFDSLFPDFKVRFRDVPDPNKQFGEKEGIIERISLFPRKKKTARIRISWGCNQNCAYCARSRAIGKLKSKPMRVLRDEYERLLRDGYRNFIFISANPGEYGMDIGSSLTRLMESFDEIDSGLDVKWDIRELSPVSVISHRKKLGDEIKKGKIPSLQCTIQSGSERILKLMKRYSDVKEIQSTLDDFRKLNKDLILRTHVIAGFPSETDEDFETTLVVLKKVGFNHVTLFPYYDAPETISSRMKKKVSAEVVNKRISMAVESLKKSGCKVDIFS